VAETLPIYLTNTLGRVTEEFEPLETGVVKIYTCGPTVYSYSHIGNFRSFIMADTLRRMFEYNGYEVRHVRNITDVGHLTDEELATGVDRMELGAQRENRSVWDLAQHYTDVFFADADRLNLLPPTRSPRATEYIPSMIALAERLIATGHAYDAAGNVYYAVDTFPTYGRLSGNTVEDLIAGARVEVGEGKRFAADFALWKVAAPDKAMRWESPWGTGVPGWHLECSAMAFDLLGEQLDIHTGGIDNMFPHHEDEIAQSEAASGKPFVGYWLHSQWLVAAGEEKMSKSKGNFYTVGDLVEMGIDPLSYRYFTFQAHYRTPLSFSWAALEAAQTALVRIWEAAAELSQETEAGQIGAEAESCRARFHQAINRDLDLPGAVAVLHETLGTGLPADQKLALLADFDRVLGLRMLERAGELSAVSDVQQALLDERAEARTTRDWARSDELRARLAASGVEVKDTPKGQRWVNRGISGAGR
jgi:cysteinyl-tRNA synthetase